MKELIKIQYRTEIVGIKNRKYKYFAEVIHTSLNDFRIFSSDNKGVLQTKVNIHVSKLQDKWKKIVDKENEYRNKAANLKIKEANKENEYRNKVANLKIKEANHKEAQLRTEEAIKALQDVENILLHTLDTNDAID